MTLRHQGKTMIVTGAAGSIGLATCEILCREGARVMLVDIAADRLANCTTTLRGAGHDVTAPVDDCADAAAVESYPRAAVEAGSRIGVIRHPSVDGGSLAPPRD